eukprot:CAMPEP_0174737532 /NCGR_PEP_ID=MMETSP1094-20130205/68453_1 /TAXON_ID=156173 /ORGANISM="Chrysochromulina brevifilum, Strain UTEX LB 985" /LENGTH=62 /DNA_ID=CAMNT_0015940775 /DNA_START=429 /DNA_END=617 /DNA_ORIENTATION=+
MQCVLQWLEQNGLSMAIKISPLAGSGMLQKKHCFRRGGSSSGSGLGSDANSDGGAIDSIAAE